MGGLTGRRLFLWWLLFLASITTMPGVASGQLTPDLKWRTIRTEHFQVHYSPGLEEHARRAAVNAERAYAQLAAELVPPRGPLDLVIADNVDFTNGFATPFPSNRIVIYTHPPITSSALRFYDEWSALVITHELTHIFQLDRARGWWRVAQRIFGRSPPFMPNAYTPSWLTEGLAVYYESRLTGSGRLHGTEHGMVARADAIAGTSRRLDEVSLATSRYPEGQSVYVYGSLLFEHIAKTRGAEQVPEFVERLSGAPLPFFLNRAARGTFGVTLIDAWREFQDSLRREVSAAGAPMSGWRELTTSGREVQSPRWLSETSILYSANTGRELPGAYVVDLDGRNRRIGRRNGVEANVPLADGSIVFAQLEFLNPYDVRSDLWIQRGGRQRRLTHGARVTHPDVRTDGAIVAVQAVPGTTRLVRMAADGRGITPITSAAVDTQWSEPRWSPDGNRIAAVRRARNGVSEIVVLDADGRLIESLSRSRSVEGSPSWTPDGSTIVFSSDRGGSPQLYAISAASPVNGGATPVRISNAATGMIDPSPSWTSPMIAALHYRSDGYHAGVAPFSLPVTPVVPTTPERVRDTVPRTPLAPLPMDTSATRPYRPWRTLIPRYWLPISGTGGDDEISIGALTSSEDVIGRHAYSADLAITPATGHIAGGAGYTYAGLGNPLIGASFFQSSDYDPIRRSGEPAILGYLRERTHLLAFSTTFRRPRFRTSSSITISGELERTTYTTRPAALLPQLSADLSPREYSAVAVSAGWSNAQRPSLSISPEDGISVSGSARQRWLRDGGKGMQVFVGAVRSYKSLDLPGFSHHALAARIAGGYASSNSTTDFGIGGTSGSSIEVIPGYTFGDVSRTFGVRGFPASSQQGLRAAAASIEYRAPLLLASRGFRALPIFFDKLSLALFADGGSAWCPPIEPEIIACRDVPHTPEWLVSAGGELNLDAALSYDVPYRFRLGVAAPIERAGLARPDPVTVYFTLGLSF